MYDFCRKITAFSEIKQTKVWFCHKNLQNCSLLYAKEAVPLQRFLYVVLPM
jgi:hypothetical protein